MNCGDSACVPLFFLAQRAKQHATVLHSGEGPTKSWAAIPFYKRCALSRLHSSPVGIVAGLFDRVEALPQSVAVGAILRHMVLPLKDRYECVSLFWNGIKAKSSIRSADCQTKDSFLEEPFWMYFQRVRLTTGTQPDALWIRGGLPEMLLKADKMTMAESIELRVHPRSSCD